MISQPVGTNNASVIHCYVIATLTGVPFPKTFIPICKKILTRLYRVFVHIYIHHFDKLLASGAVSDDVIICGCGSAAVAAGSSCQLVLQALLLFCSGVQIDGQQRVWAFGEYWNNSHRVLILGGISIWVYRTAGYCCKIQFCDADKVTSSRNLCDCHMYSLYTVARMPG